MRPWYDPTTVGFLPLLETQPWQMSTAERAYLVLLVSQLRPRHAVEVGSGGSTIAMEQFARRLTVVDPNPTDAVVELKGVELVQARSQDVLAGLITPDVDFVLIDGDHGFDAVTSDLTACLDQPKHARVVLMHDTADAVCREAIDGAGLDDCPWVHHVDLDVVPGHGGWGGLGVVHLNLVPR